MKKFSLSIITLLLTVTPIWAQGKVMQVHSDGSVVYEIPTAQVDSVTFKAKNNEVFPCFPKSGAENWTVENCITEASVWKCFSHSDLLLEYTFYPSKNELHIKTIPNELPWAWLIIGGNGIANYCIKDNMLYFQSCREDYDSPGWIFTFYSENEMSLSYNGYYPANRVGMFCFVRQTK